MTVNEKVSITDHMSRIRLPDFSKLAINPKNNKDVTIFWHGVITKIVWHCRVFLVNFSYWSKFHGSIITGSGVMTIFVCKGRTRNPEIENTSVWVLPNIWRLGQVRDTKFGTNVSNKKVTECCKIAGLQLLLFLN